MTTPKVKVQKDDLANVFLSYKQPFDGASLGLTSDRYTSALASMAANSAKYLTILLRKLLKSEL
jgi:hypothetical protein